MNVPTRQDRVAQCVRALTARPEFPAFSKHVQKLLLAVEDHEKSVSELTDLIIRDYSLTLKLLRAANACNISRQPILSVSHAVFLIGTEEVRHLASSLLIFEHFRNKPAGVRELMMLSMLSANHVREIARMVPGLQPEEAYLCGMVRNLGEVLIGYYQPTQYAKILELVEQQKQPLAIATLEVLQFSFEDLGQAIAKYWGMPDKVAICQRPWVASPSSGAANANLLHAAVSMGHLLTTSVYRLGMGGNLGKLKMMLRDFCSLLPLEQKDVERILNSAIRETQESFAAIGVRINQLRLQSQTQAAVDSLATGKPTDDNQSVERLTRDAVSLLAALGVQTREPAPPSDMPDDAGPRSIFDTDEPVDALPEAVAAPSDEMLGRLTKDVCTVLSSHTDQQLSPFILMVLEALYRGIGFDRVLFAFVNQERTRMEGRLGLGENIDDLIGKFQFRMSMSGGPVSVALMCKRDVIASTARDKSSDVARIFGCNFAVIYPIVVARQIVACLYMESQEPRGDLTPAQLQHMEELREALASAIERERRRN